MVAVLAEINEALVSALTILQQHKFSSEKKEVDGEIHGVARRCLESELSRVARVYSLSAEEWRKIRSKTTYYFQFNERNFPSKYSENVTIINQPNGKQAFPDMLLVHNYIGLPLEIKTCSTDIISWNDGIPMRDAVYVFYCCSLAKTTFFLGQDHITDEWRDSLFKQRDCLRFLQSYEDEKPDWYLYPRPKFEGRTVVAANNLVAGMRERAVLQYLASLTWDERQTVDFNKGKKYPAHELVNFIEDRLNEKKRALGML